LISTNHYIRKFTYIIKMITDFVNTVGTSIVSNISDVLNGGSKAVRELKYNRDEATRILHKYPDRVPVIVNRAVNASDKTPHIDRNKFLVPGELTVGQFLYVIRKRLLLPPHEALFLFVDNAIPPTSSLMSSVYEEMHDESSLFLYISYSLENVFGSF
jgi:GABA(A) receptor-associated protein